MTWAGRALKEATALLGTATTQVSSFLAGTSTTALVAGSACTLVTVFVGAYLCKCCCWNGRKVQSQLNSAVWANGQQKKSDEVARAAIRPTRKQTNGPVIFTFPMQGTASEDRAAIAAVVESQLARVSTASPESAATSPSPTKAASAQQEAVGAGKNRPQRSRRACNRAEARAIGHQK